MRRVRLETLGCRLNEAELETWAEQFRARGFAISGADDPADLLVINTCAVTTEAVRKSRQRLRRLQRHNPHAQLVVTGCASAPEANAALPAVDLLVLNQDKERLVDVVCEHFGQPETDAQVTRQLLYPTSRQRAFIKIQDGCRYQCTFCFTTIARGAERSRPLAAIINQINHRVDQGVQEIVLSGVQLSGYGVDLGLDLTQLIAQILTATDVPRLRLGSVEPWDLGDDFWALFANPRLAPHLHLPLQSGSDAVLRRMGRRCKTAEFCALVDQARAQIADFNVTTDLIVGFPGETEAEWQQTLDIVDTVGFGDIHIFVYSPRPGTAAAQLSDQVAPAIQKQRSHALHQRAAIHRQAVWQRYLGRTLAVLLEGTTQDSQAHGYTPNYLPVRLISPPTCTAPIQPIRLERIEEDVVLGSEPFAI